MQLKKFFSVVFILLVLGAATAAWIFLGSATKFKEDRKSFYIKTGSSYEVMKEALLSEGIVSNGWAFNLLAQWLKYPAGVKAGKYVIEKKASIVSIVRMLKAGNQTPVKLVINKLRIKENLAQKLAASFECDSISIMSFLNNPDSLAKLRLDTNTAMTLVIPNTYSVLWNLSAGKILRKLYGEQQKFWTSERIAKATGLNLSTAQAYTLASIVEEETNMEADKGKIASVYLNRIETGMRLGADPTVKFAMKNFGLKRIYQKHLGFPSPYNTYQHAGLPPGPICTPSIKTIDAVLNAPSTSYLYFVAKPDFRGYSNFATTYPEHLQFAKAYQQALDVLMRSKIEK